MTSLLKSVKSGRSITLAKKLASSGEGTVWTTNLPGFLAKLYHTPTPDRIQKLEVMVEHPPQNPMRDHHHVTFAWPQDLLQDDKGQCLGFLMPEIADSVKLSLVYNPKLRNRKAPRFNWYYLHTAALNFALALKSLHEESYVVGDIKPQNLLVNNRALISVIDTDSFQVRNPNNQTVYRCLVGSEGFTPAELLGKELSSLDQTEVHDRFRLGVMVYMLLFGDQPFKGKWVGRGESPQPSDLIRDGYWPYASNSLVQPGPNTIPLSIIHPQLQVCFQRCFTEGHRNPQARPSAQDWSDALKLAIMDLRMCHLENNHFYSRTYGRCYWCDRRSAVSVDIFSPTPAVPRINSTQRRTVSPQKLIRTAPPGKGLQSRSTTTLTMANLQALKSLQTASTLQPNATSSLSNALSRWSHPVVWGMACISVGLIGLSLLLLPELNMESLQKGGVLLEATLDKWFQPNRPKDTNVAVLTDTAKTDQSNIIRGGHWEPITALDISTDDRYLVSGSKDTTVKLWSFPSGELQHTFAEHYEPIVSVGVSADQKTLTTGSLSGKVFTWNLETSTLANSFAPSGMWDGPEDAIRSSATDRQGQLMASSGLGGAILLQSLKSGRVIKIPPRSLGTEQSLAVLPNGKTVVSSGSDGRFYLWDAMTGLLVKTFPNNPKGEPLEPISVLAGSSDGKQLVSGGWYGSITLWNIATGTPIQRFSKQLKPISVLAVSDRGDRVATIANDALIRLWDVKTGNLIGTLKGHTAPVTALKFSHDGRFLVSGGDEPSIKIWNLAKQKLRATLVQ